MNVRSVERSSIRAFVKSSSEYLRGRVLDFGCGEQPYKEYVTGEYFPYDPLLELWANIGPYDAILCTQVLQYIENPVLQLRAFREMLKPGGKLVLTYPTNWDEVESNDFWRFTRAGMELMLIREGFKVLRHERRASIVNPEDRFEFPLGYGCVAERI